MNRNKILEAFISNLANVIIHQVLEKAIDKREIAEVYSKEMKNSFEIAKRYREKINPVNSHLPFHDIEEIKAKLKREVNSELKLRIEKGYRNIDLSLVPGLVEKFLKDMKVIS